MMARGQLGHSVLSALCAPVIHSAPRLGASSFTSKLSRRPLLSCLVVEKVTAKVKVVKCLKNHSHRRNFVKTHFSLCQFHSH